MLDLKSDIAHSFEVAVVEYDSRLTARKPDVAFDAGADPERLRESGEAVFRFIRSMQAPMREARRAWVEGVRA